jgi:serine protein kinase
MHEDPLRLIPVEFRPAILADLNEGLTGLDRIVIEGELCPACRFVHNQLLEEAGGDWTKVIDKVHIKRILLSEKDRIGIGTFQPKDEKNQDSTELTGDINYRKIAEYGSDSDPRAFNFDGELNIANRGIVEFIEILKLDVAFLYDLLTASQEHKIKPKKFAHTDIDEVILGHTNEAEYRRLLSNEYMEALRDRTIKIDVPYNIRYADEVRIYQRDFNERRVVGKHIAPHTLQLAAFWAVLTRLEEPKRHGLTLVQKLRLYDGRSLPGFTEDSVIELQAEAKNEGMFGISPRYIQDKISNALVNDQGGSCLNPFMIMRALETGLKHHSLITNEEERKRYRELLSSVRSEYDEIVKNEVQRVITADEEAIKRLAANYIDNIKAYTQKQKVRNPFTGQDESPDERLMRSIEEKIEIPDSRKDDFRREIMNYIGALAIDGKRFEWDSNERLRRALEMKLFEDQKDSIKLTSLVSNVIDEETQEKIEVVKNRMIKNMGYCDVCATDVLNYVASIFARGDTEERK